MRIDGNLTGGDIKDGTLTQGQLRRDLSITRSGTHPPSQTNIAPPKRTSCAAVKFTPAQATINRKIAVAAVIRTNLLLDRLRAGLSAENFRHGTISGADFRPGVVR